MVMVRVMIMVMVLMVMVKMMVTSSVSEPKRRRSKGMAATRSIINQPLINNIVVKDYQEDENYNKSDNARVRVGGGEKNGYLLSFLIRIKSYLCSFSNQKKTRLQWVKTN